MKKLVFSLLLSLVLSGCALLETGRLSDGADSFSTARAGAVKIESVRGAAHAGNVVPLSVTRAQLREILAKGSDLNQLRVVQVTQSSSANSNATPEYRLFGIKSGSVADVLGLANADILIAANGYVVFSPKQFADYLYALSELKQGSIELRRNQEALQLNYTILD